MLQSFNAFSQTREALDVEFDSKSMAVAPEEQPALRFGNQVFTSEYITQIAWETCLKDYVGKHDLRSLPMCRPLSMRPGGL